MSTIKEVSSYKTTDDEIFKTFREAEKHQADLDLEEVYEGSNIDTNYEITFSDLKEWLDKNFAAVVAYLTATEAVVAYLNATNEVETPLNTENIVVSGYEICVNETSSLDGEPLYRIYYPNGSSVPHPELFDSIDAAKQWLVEEELIPHCGPGGQ